MRLILPMLLCAAQTVFADEVPLPLLCSGTSPDWEMQVTEDGTQFSYLYESDLNIALETQADGADWPRALTLIGRGDSAILMIEPASCDSGDLSARVLTQRGETPVLLVGCCELPDS